MLQCLATVPRYSNFFHTAVSLQYFGDATVPQNYSAPPYSIRRCYSVPLQYSVDSTVPSTVRYSPPTVVLVQYSTAATVSRTMVSPLLHGLTEDPMSLEASLSSSPQTSSTTASVCGEGTISSNSRGCSLGIVLPTTSSLGDNLVTVGDSIQSPVMHSNPLTMGSKSYADLLRPPKASVQSFPTTSPPLKKVGFVVLASGERPWKLVDLKAKLSKHWLIPADWRLISLGKRLFLDHFEVFWDKNKVWGLGLVNLKPGVIRLQPWVPDFNPFLQKSTNAQVLRVPLRLDKATIDGDFGHYARVLVDVDMSVLLPSSVLLERDEFHSSFISVETSSTVVGSIPIPLSGDLYVQQVCNIFPRKVPPPSYVVVSLGSHVMEAISLGIPSQYLCVGVSVASYGLTIQDDRRIMRDGINPSRVMRLECSLSNSQTELRFIDDSSWAKQVEADDLDSDGLAQRTMMAKHRLEAYKSEFQTPSSRSHD
ncbi:hypothetical protein Dsin_017446 [Dipteronia sinensis]|uniref:DUF4283 domain-containing protein n=1 Tax=Dipteronia sinensis TaxID=43782 RepID=A0AAE0AGF0_9ROSI|nr:hypothetical protein Dsin_017446 [Dipteronia sinensis]